MGRRGIGVSAITGPGRNISGMTVDRWLGVSQVAKRLDRCPETVRRMIRSGHLHASRLPGNGRRGGNYMIAESVLEKFLADLATSGDTPHRPIALQARILPHT